MRGLLLRVVSVASLLAAGSTATASILFSVSHLQGNTWEYTYTPVNDGLAVDLEEFTVFFDLGLYENLVLPAAPAGWTAGVAQPDPRLPDDGFYDALALVAGIAPGGSLGGFTVRFDFLGAGTPGSQRYDIVDPRTGPLVALESGQTRPAPTPGVPEPTGLPLLGAGLAGLAAAGRRRRWVVPRGDST